MDLSPVKILVGFHSSVSNQLRLQIHQQIGTILIDEIPELNVHIVAVDTNQFNECISRYSRFPGVKYAEQYGFVKATCNPNPVNLNHSYPLNKWGFYKIQIPQAWTEILLNILKFNHSPKERKKPKQVSSVIVAVLDSGIDQNHPYLSQTIFLNKNFSNSRTVNDVFGHGTHIAGIIEAITNNRIGSGGVTLNTVRLMNIKVLDDRGEGTISWVAKGIVYATDHGAQVINMSLATPKMNQTLLRAVQYAVKKGVILVSAAGNDGIKTVYYPAGFPEVISVAATDENDKKAHFSNFGASKVDVAAPGVNILSTAVTLSDGRQALYRFGEGTSQAASFVSGLAGLILAINPKLKGSVRKIIEFTADPVPGFGYYYKYGRINALKAVKHAINQTYETDF